MASSQRSSKLKSDDRQLSKQGSKTFSPEIEEYLRFVKKNCVYLSFDEKEKINTMIKQQDTILIDLFEKNRAVAIPKEQFKEAIFAILYPKRVSSKLLDKSKELSRRESNESFRNMKDSQISDSSLSNRMEENKKIPRADTRKSTVKSIKDSIGSQILPNSDSRSISELHPSPRNDNNLKNFKKTPKNVNPEQKASDVLNRMDEYIQKIMKHQKISELAYNEDRSEDFEGTSTEFLKSIGAIPKEGHISALQAYIKKESDPSPIAKDQSMENPFKKNPDETQISFVNQLDNVISSFSESPMKQQVAKMIGKADSNERNANLNAPGHDANLNGVSSKAREVIEEILKNENLSEKVPNLSTKLRQSAILKSSMINLTESPSKSISAVKTPDKRLSLTTPEKNSVGRYTSGKTPYMGSQSLPDTNLQTEEEEFDVLHKINQQFISVNYIKKVCEFYNVFAEDIVDEIFRYLGENIVNKTYFCQIFSNYFNCLPRKAPVRLEEISHKVFEVADQNKDGLISVNDLGSGCTLFCQQRPGETKEKLLYTILDPLEKGFILPIDIMNVLKKAQTIATSMGSKIFDDESEIQQFSAGIFKEIGKEKKGNITYWDLFLWRKDTNSFSMLYENLAKYKDKLLEVSGVKKQIASLKTVNKNSNHNFKSSIQNEANS